MPTTPHGFKDAASDPAQVRKLWEQYPGELIGVPTGKVSGIDVLDVDTKPEAKAWWADNHQRFPRTRIHRTRSGGLHFLFEHDDTVRCSASKIARGVDTRGNGGLVIWWPAAGLPLVSDAPLAPWPAWMMEIIQPPRQHQQKNRSIAWTPRDDDDRRVRDALQRIDADDRDVWLHVGMALKDEYGGAGRALWDEWSQRSNKYDAADQDKIWNSFRRDGISIGTLFWYAKKAGWSPDEPRAAS